MSSSLSDTTEDYLKVIYHLTSSGQRASTNMVARRMGVSAASATGMLQRLATSEPPLVEYQKHHGVLLTPAGEQAALKVIRHHRLLETFLFQVLGYTWDEVHSEADRLEHAISADLEERISQAVGDPQHDPHGEPIPARDLTLPAQSKIRLTELHSGQTALVQRVGNPTPPLLRYLATIGVVPNAQVTMLENSILQDIVLFQITGRAETQVLGRRQAEDIFVDVLDGD